MRKIATILLKCVLYFVFGYIPLLIICILITASLTALVIQTIDYCYGSMACLGHGFTIGFVGGIVGWQISLIISVLLIDHRMNNKHQQSKRKRKPKRVA